WIFGSARVCFSRIHFHVVLLHGGTTSRYRCRQGLHQGGFAPMLIVDAAPGTCPSHPVPV
ncbi:hypothetical protein PanWU01x14_151190, partial [Parasponia andersonii]